MLADRAGSGTALAPAPPNKMATRILNLRIGMPFIGPVTLTTGIMRSSSRHVMHLDEAEAQASDLAWDWDCRAPGWVSGRPVRPPSQSKRKSCLHSYRAEKRSSILPCRMMLWGLEIDCFTRLSDIPIRKACTRTAIR